MRYRADKQVIDKHTETDTRTHTDAGNDNTRKSKIASGKNDADNLKPAIVAPGFCLIGDWIC